MKEKARHVDVFVAFWQTSKRPWLCAIHVVGFSIVAFLLMVLQPPLEVAILPVGMLFQYVVSIRYHWLEHSGLRARVDRITIAALIVTTFLPYWLTQLAWPEIAWRLLGMLPFIGVTCWMVWYHNEHRKKLIAVGYLCIGAYGIGTSLPYLHVWLSAHNLFLFWSGVMCYLIMQACQVFRLPNEQMFRVVQHIWLVVAFVQHTLALTDLYAH